MVVKTQSAQGTPPLAAKSSIGPGTQLGALRVSQPIILWPYPLTLLGLFRLLLLELKIMVFDFALRGTWHGRVPPLIRALRTRGTKDLYDLATTSFINGNTYRIRQNNGWGFDDMQIKSIARIQEMSIDIGWEANIRTKACSPLTNKQKGLACTLVEAGPILLQERTLSEGYLPQAKPQDTPSSWYQARNSRVRANPFCGAQLRRFDVSQRPDQKVWRTRDCHHDDLLYGIVRRYADPEYEHVVS